MREHPWNAANELLIEGVLPEMFRLEHHLAMMKAIASRADAINASVLFAPALGGIQSVLSHASSATFCRLMERATGRNRVRSLRRLLKQIRDTRLAPARPGVVHGFLARRGIDSMVFDSDTLSVRLVEVIEVELGKLQATRAAQWTREHRDKMVAHAERDLDGDSGPTWSESDQLLDVLHEIVSVLCHGYFEFRYELAPGVYVMRELAKEPRESLEALLESAGMKTGERIA